ncbi:PREDICTED: non-structural maintenance of chromosome element 4 isoform X1 [Drosophila arizonae]|uniref:Non-structural maintenance of chromosomes element 4 n=2 Tax=Drosophila arizonae TaxID=7263 RepID=A0ABM1NUZ3_DROAR|nr:PREDICTED: non-structural maintenance of chromosome element 4 isoform X1 [Drosophila arizonae]
MDCTDNMQTSQQDEEVEESGRIIQLQDLIEKNIQIEQKIESRSFGESMSAIFDILGKANDVVKGYEERKTNSTEILLDSELLRRNHEVVGKAIQYNTNITDRMYCTAINNVVFKDNVEDWNALCSLACRHGVPSFTNASMLPFINVEPKQLVPKQRAARKTTINAVEKRPKQADKLERRGEGSAAVNHVMKQIKNIYRAGNNQPIPYFKLICNPQNFMDTVQNSLIISFLIKENLIWMENGADGLPQIKLNNSKESIASEPFQAICRLDLELCEKYAKYYNIKEPMLKRAEVDES